MTQRAKAALDGSRFADLRWATTTGSTNDDLVAAALDGAGECVLVADHQSTGRGRLDRRWEAPAGSSLLMSVLVRGPLPPSGPHLLTIALAVAASDAVAALTDVDVGLKWPNDVVALAASPDGRDLKLGGLLAQFVPAAQQSTGPAGSRPGDAVVLGLGLNTAWADTGFPEDLAASATSLDLLGASVDRSDLVVAILQRLEDTRDLGTSGTARDQLLAAYRRRCTTLGQRVRVELPGAQGLVGTAVDIADDASLVVSDDAGVEHVVSVGDVVHLRPGD